MSRNATGNEPSLPHKAGHKPSKPGRGIWFKPGLVLTSFVFFWAASHEPPAFTATSISIWIFGAITAALLAKAALVLTEPVTRILLTLLSPASKNSKSGSAGP